eukprot:7313068-Pyramimonas_sp.AAC.1
MHHRPYQVSTYPCHHARDTDYTRRRPRPMEGLQDLELRAVPGRPHWPWSFAIYAVERPSRQVVGPRSPRSPLQQSIKLYNVAAVACLSYTG